MGEEEVREVENEDETDGEGRDGRDGWEEIVYYCEIGYDGGESVLCWRRGGTEREEGEEKEKWESIAEERTGEEEESNGKIRVDRGRLPGYYL
jgi:hypothetical protein